MNVVGQFHQTILQMDTLHLYGRRKLQIDVGEVPDGLDVGLCERVRHFPGLRFGDREDHNVHIVCVDIFLQLTERADRYPSDRLSEKLRVHIESTDKIESALFEFQIPDKCLAQITGPYQDHVVLMIKAQNFPDFFVQIVGVVSISLLTESPEIIEILYYDKVEASPQVYARYLTYNFSFRSSVTTPRSL